MSFFKAVKDNASNTLDYSFTNGDSRVTKRGGTKQFEETAKGNVISGTIRNVKEVTTNTPDRGEQIKLIVAIECDATTKGYVKIKDEGMVDLDLTNEAHKVLNLWVDASGHLPQQLFAACGGVLNEGDRLSVTLTSLKDTGKPNLARQFEVKHTASAPVAEASDFDED